MSGSTIWRRVAGTAVLVAALVPGAAGAGSVGDTPRLDAVPPPAEAASFRPAPNLVALGKRVFFDPRLSEPRGTACVACHDPARAFAPTLTGEALHAGVPAGSRPGHLAPRSAPSLLYIRYLPRRYFFQDDDASFPSPFGGFFADGRADSIAEQIRGPLFSPDEMGNRSPRALLRKVAGTDLGEALARQFGAGAVRDPERMIGALGQALEAYFRSDEMAPFSSRFDAFLRHRAPLSPAEMRGLALFRNPDKGNCAACHTMVESSSRPERSLFTDFGYDAIAAPRNPLLPANRDPRHFDLGLCRTARALKWPEPDQWCGYFRTAGLRNVAVRQTFMHNGVFRTLRDAVAFYATRSTDPAQWYPGGRRFDDVPARHQGNVNVNAVPMNRRQGTAPALTDDEIDDIVAFLRTLTDARYVARMPDPATDKARPAQATGPAGPTVAAERRAANTP
ncbi:cytochrome-c peroxidase [Ralstonia pseudosolanacearum]|uniref:cytochrome-c peroxidase n=3 Tax=Ralstonia pseudosolanacearum TaxID=1310165 RepID=UPI0018D06816|nr:cytochrome-c peroxidase [Ralstonia pseudosolanacearum]